MCVHRLARACGSRPVVGSSRKTSVGSWIRPMAMSRRRRWPPDIVLGLPVPQPVEVELRRTARWPRRRGVGRATCRRASRGRRPRRRRGRRAKVRAALRDVADAAAHLLGLADHVVAGDRGGARRGRAAGSSASAASSSCRRRWGRGSRRPRPRRRRGRRRRRRAPPSSLALPGLEGLHEPSCVDHGPPWSRLNI